MLVNTRLVEEGVSQVLKCPLEVIQLALSSAGASVLGVGGESFLEGSWGSGVGGGVSTDMFYIMGNVNLYCLEREGRLGEGEGRVMTKDHPKPSLLLQKNPVN